MRHKESDLQIACVKWFRYQYQDYRLNLFSVPNGGHRRIETAIWMQREGQVSGVSDLILAVPSSGYSALFIEIKIKPNKQSKAQREFQNAVERFPQYKYTIIYDYDQFKKEITEYLCD
jgi:hypothetical protein